MAKNKHIICLFFTTLIYDNESGIQLLKFLKMIDTQIPHAHPLKKDKKFQAQATKIHEIIDHVSNILSVLLRDIDLIYKAN